LKDLTFQYLEKPSTYSVKKIPVEKRTSNIDYFEFGVLGSKRGKRDRALMVARISDSE
jgi:hypothetical protein